jgi:hypothetical protein
MKAKKALKRLNQVESILSNVIGRYPASNPGLLELLDSAIASVVRATKAVTSDETGQMAPKKRTLSAAARKRISMAQKERWSALKKAEVEPERLLARRQGRRPRLRRKLGKPLRRLPIRSLANHQENYRRRLVDATIRERIHSMRAATAFTIRFALLVAVTLSLTMIGIEVFLYRPLLAMPGGSTFVLKSTVVLLLYEMLIVWATRSDGPLRRPVLLGTPVGLIAAAVQLAHLAAENFIHFGERWESITTLTFMLSTFLIWGVAGYRGARSAGAIAPGVMSGSWSAIVTMSILVAFGFALEFYLATPKPEYVVTWAEFKRTGWTDVHAFTIANTLDSALSHLIVGPIVGAIMGGVGGVVTRIPRKPQPGTAIAQA